MSDLPPPPVPLHTDLSGLDYMPVMVKPLLTSRSWAKCGRRPELAFYLWNIWLAAWVSQPAASLEDCDDVLREAAKCPPEKWDEYRDDILAGFTLHSDGRRYHQFLAQQAVIALAKREKFRTKKARQRAEAEARQAAAAAGVPPLSPGTGPGTDPGNAVTTDDRRKTKDNYDVEAAEVVEAFLSLRGKHWHGWPNPASGGGSLLLQAKEYLVAGATVAICREVMDAGMAMKKAGGETPPTNLRFFKNSIPDAIAKFRRSRPVEPPRPARPNRPQAKDVQAMLDRQMAQFSKGSGSVPNAA